MAASHDHEDGSLTLINPTDIQVRETLGGGGTFGGCVSLATRKHWGDVVVKKYDNIIFDEHIVEELNKSATTFPHVVNTIGVIDDPGEPVSLVIEYMEFGNLRDFNLNTMMKCACWARKVKMIHEIALGMSYLQGLLHCKMKTCLKLEHVLVGSGFVAKIAGNVDSVIAPNRSTDDRTFSSEYVPPEAWTNKDQKLDEAWNIYAFAILLHGFFTGKAPWPSDADSSKVSSLVQDGTRPDMSHMPLDSPGEIVILMQRCWDGTRVKRPPFKEIHETVYDVYQKKHRTLIRRADKAIMNVLANEEAVKHVHGRHSTMHVPGTIGSPQADRLPADMSSHLDVMRRERKVSARIGYTGPPPGLVIPEGPAATHNTREWRLVKQFGREGEKDGEFRLAENIAVCQQGNIAVVDTRTTGGKRVYLFDKDGGYKFTLKSHNADPSAEVLLPEDVAVTTQNHLVVVDQTQYVKIFQTDGLFLKSFSTLCPDDDPDEKVTPTCVTVTPQGEVIVGDRQRRLVTIHSEANNWIPKKVTAPIRPWYLACNSKGHILMSDDWERTVVAVNQEGAIQFMIEDFTVDGQNGEPYGMACDSNDDVYIAVMKISKSNQARQGSGHIHQYDNKGNFIRCIAKYLRHPYGIIMSNGSLYVANKKSVHIYTS